MEVIFFLIAIFSTTIGAVSGLGGGTIIKPMLDAVSGLPLSAINFMSSCTVLTMTFLTIFRGRKDELDIPLLPTCYLAVGAACGGVFGKFLLSHLSGNVSLVQSYILLIINVIVYIYMKYQDKTPCFYMKSYLLCLLIGMVLGAISSFLGIGGGTLNMMILYLLFGNSAKVTAKQSIYIIFLAQLMSVLTTLREGIPVGVVPMSLIVMMIGGALGANLGRSLSKKLTESQMKGFFVDVLVAMIALNAFNIGRLL